MVFDLDIRMESTPDFLNESRQIRFLNTKNNF